ncbi:hypothetical protein [Mycoplasma phocoeninasale]|uniref:hypothetical protein n=1 Tax=Mycoplasma phocoeninasale TaxID=2726117 RepID=UPI00196839CD|nr:hypothetical protein [Mycoplasma phocoeninasale]MBN0970578.1 hypothetical protein [Mycoplasma phocoeninasale]
MLNRKKIWEHQYGDATSAKDYAGRTIKRDVDKNSPFYWNVEHINPKRGDAYDNLIPAHPESNTNKADRPAWSEIDKNTKQKVRFRILKISGDSNADYSYIIQKCDELTGDGEWEDVTRRKFLKK